MISKKNQKGVSFYQYLYYVKMEWKKSEKNFKNKIKKIGRNI